METFTFQDEVKQLLSRINDAFSSNKDIFLSELINNAADALDKMCFDKSKLVAQPQIFIHIVPDKANNTLTIMDSGIGMTKADLVNNLGKLSRYGTNEFMQAIAAGADVSGVGFYSYLVAKKVIVTTKHDDDEQYVLESQACGSFNVSRDASGENLGRGTKVTLYLKEDQLAYLNEGILMDIIKKYSARISYPISLWLKTDGCPLQNVPDFKLTTGTAILALRLGGHRVALFTDSRVCVEGIPTGHRTKIVDLCSTVSFAGAGGSTYIHNIVERMCRSESYEYYENQVEDLDGILASLLGACQVEYITNDNGNSTDKLRPTFAVVSMKGNISGIGCVYWDKFAKEFKSGVVSPSHTDFVAVGSGTTLLREWKKMKSTPTTPTARSTNKEVSEWGRDGMIHAFKNRPSLGGDIDGRILSANQERKCFRFKERVEGTFDYVLV